jgi:hypothetical protein
MLRGRKGREKPAHASNFKKMCYYEKPYTADINRFKSIQHATIGK